MTLHFKSQLPNMDGIYAALFSASEVIYAELKKGSGLKFAHRAMSQAMIRSSLMSLRTKLFLTRLKLTIM